MSLPVPVSRGALRRTVTRLVAGLAPAMGTASAIADCARRQGVQPIAVVQLQGRRHSLQAPTALLVHASSPLEQRAALLEALAAEFSEPSYRLLALGETEWHLWQRCSSYASSLPERADWGALPGSVAAASSVQLRTSVLRRASSIYLDRLHQLLATGAPGPDVAEASAQLRDLLAEVAVPARFPPVPAVDATVADQHAAAIGVCHAAFAGERAGADLPAPIEADFVASRTAQSARRLVVPLLADLSAPTVRSLRALYLLPGPWGTRHQWRLLAVIPDDAPLLEAVALRRHLQQHLAMLPARERAAILAEGGSPVLLTESALAGLLAGRLFARPLQRLAICAHRQLLVGADVIAAMLGGQELFTRADLETEISALLEESAACWPGESRSLWARDLLFGAWPAVLHLCRGGAATDSLQAIHAELRSSTDPALSRVGSAADTQGWGDPSCVDRSRSRKLLREWGPTLLRLQEATLEALG